MRSNADVEVRREAIHSIGRRTDESNVDDLIRIYDAETDEQIRRSVLSALSILATSAIMPGRSR